MMNDLARAMRRWTEKKRAEWRLIVTFAPLTKRIAAAECLNLGG